MRTLFLILVIILAVDSLLPGCANPKAPTGGPMDSIPPILLGAEPPHESLLFKGSEIILHFNERVTAEKIQSNLIITPQIENKYKAIVKKNTVILKFENPFPDSTTVTLNFFDGITDVTEKNPAVNLTHVFSTGHFLDSLQISGSVTNLFKKTLVEKMTVGIYRYTDSLDLQAEKPLYFTTTDENGKFKITNIKNGKYKLLAFKDANRNLRFEGSSESFGFLPGIIHLDSNITDLDIQTIKINVDQLKLLSRRSLGNYFDIRYSKGLDSINIDQPLSYTFLPETNSIRIYKPDSFILTDSLKTIVQVQDSVRNELIDTLYIKFNESVRKPPALTYKLAPEGDIEYTQKFTLAFNKPMLSFDSSKFRFVKDSTISMPIDTTFSWNRNKTKFTLIQTIDTSWYYSRQRQLIKQADSLNRLKSDTTLVDSLLQKNNPPTTRDKVKSLATRSSIPRFFQGVQLMIQKGAFISIENDTLEQIDKTYNFKTAANTGIIYLNINTSQSSYTIQLINKRFEVIAEYPPSSQLKIDKLSPGDYGIRILIDDNQDGKWSIGNLLKDLPPESVFLYPDFTSLRANWDITLDISF